MRLMDMNRIVVTFDWEEEDVFTRNMSRAFVTISDPSTERYLAVEVAYYPIEERTEIDSIELVRLSPTQEGLNVDIGELKAFLRSHIKDSLKT